MKTTEEYFDELHDILIGRIAETDREILWLKAKKEGLLRAIDDLLAEKCRIKGQREQEERMQK